MISRACSRLEAEPAPGLRIRLARVDEADRLTQIAIVSKAHWGYPPSWLALWKAGMTITAEHIHAQHVLVAESVLPGSSRIDGTAAVSLPRQQSSDAAIEGPAELEHFWVSPDAMGAGVGRALMNAVLRYCSDENVDVLRIEADPNAVAFYERFGAAQVGEVESVPSPRRLPVLEITINR